ncbi:MAG TPA: helix-turn-helix transcriptional regulator, partial [Burkholderiaceae bacterium]|nr:helix-turn-helix transcriptional regulator [Burkholderiaceae bacterium]
MTDPATGSTQTDPQTHGVVTTADELVAARERKGMGKGEVAQRLKLHPRQLEAIERGDWAALPGRAFARGCVRSYGRLLEVDVEPLLRTIGGFAEAEELKPSATLAAPMPRSGGFGFDGEGHR